MQATLITNTNNDLMVANTARVSFNKWNSELDLSLSPSGKPRDPALLQYLADHKHKSPFFHIRFTMEFPSTEAIPLFAITDPTYLMGAVWSVTKGKLRFRTSYYGWVRLIKQHMIHPSYVSGIVNPLLNNPELQYCNLAYSLSDFVVIEQYDDNFLFTGTETDPHFIDASIRFHVNIPTARQLFTHRMFASNEVSRRYVDAAPEFHHPTQYRKRPAGSIKQGSSPEFVTDLLCWTYALGNERTFLVISDNEPTDIDSIVRTYYQLADTLYQSLIYSRVAPEQARGVLPQDMMTTFIFTGSLVSWSRLIHERTYSGAQQEVADVANQVLSQLVTTYSQFQSLHTSLQGEM